jgi:hypothetical protein
VRAGSTVLAGISFKNTDPQQMCHDDAKCPMGFMVWESAPFRRV